MRRALLVVAVAGVAGCGDIPQPFRHEGAPPGLARPKMTRGITVRPTDGEPGAAALAEAMVRALEDQEVPALVHAGPAFGHVIDASVQDQGGTLAVRWTLRAPDGHDAAAHLQRVPKAALAKPDPVQLKRLTVEAATAMARPLDDPDAQPATAVPLPGGSRSSVKVVPLRGLPGDGDKALTAAMKRALDRSGLLVKDEEPDYVVEGKVTIAPGLPGQDNVTVAWIVRRAAGSAELANIGQDGALPRGRLSQPWGAMARDIAEGGAVGVTEVIEADTGRGRRK